MHTVVETPGYLAAAKAAGISDQVRSEIVTALGNEPQRGELIVGAGGLRKIAVCAPWSGKSGGYRILSVYMSKDFPVFLIGAFAKNQRENITPAERVMIARRLKQMIETYTRPHKR